MRKLLTDSDIAAFSSQMALVIQAGISPYEGVAVMNEDNENDQLKKVLPTIYEELSKGESLYQSLAAAEAFPDYYLNMVRIGEMSGRLEEVMGALQVHYQRLHDQNESVKSAITYPFIMIAMMFVVVIVLITQVLPIFNQVFEQLGSSMTGFSKAVLDFGMMLSTYSYLFIGLLIVILAAAFYFAKSADGKRKFQHLLAKWSFTSDTMMKLSLSKFVSGMSIALSSGLDMEESLDISKGLIEHEELGKRIEKAKEYMLEKDLATSLVDAKILTGMYARLIKLGNKTGNVDSIMKDIADRYDQETNERIRHLISIIEPTLVAVLSVLVGIILLSVMMPLMGIMTGL